MLHTYLTISWRLRYPIIGAPMAYVGRGRLARAVSQAGGLGIKKSFHFLLLNLTKCYHLLQKTNS